MCVSVKQFRVLSGGCNRNSPLAPYSKLKIQNSSLSTLQLKTPMTNATEERLRQLREGDCVNYHGVVWQVGDYSTYNDDSGYETEEWLLNSQTGKEYYLMREVDPHNPQAQIHWYIAEELRNPSIYDVATSREVTLHLAEEMRSRQTPYSELQMFNRVYQFESETEGEYESDGRTQNRITWDYWDAPHLWNLAIEAWENGSLSVYSTREVQPADFNEAPRAKGFGVGGSLAAPALSSGQSLNARSSRSKELIIAIALMVVGFFLMLAGI